MKSNSKILLLAVLSLLFVFKLQAQDETEPVLETEVMPKFEGGEYAMMMFIYENIKYPYLARENGISGLVVISYVVNEDGSLTDFVVKRDIGGGCGEEALRVVKKMQGKWTPGYQDGEAVRVAYNLPVRFKLEKATPLRDLFRKKN